MRIILNLSTSSTATRRNRLNKPRTLPLTSNTRLLKATLIVDERITFLYLMMKTCRSLPYISATEFGPERLIHAFARMKLHIERRLAYFAVTGSKQLIAARMHTTKT